ncbi:extracellular solute-binding protein [Paenibacillus sp. J2TS4]|uniref:extracellular solute-binding protein n=1 Tax=Paenibacillus sp. J2TS4 TaxID=2807194 RepID=UPI001B21607F|nr:extracellular solute-binding protein [Paenibacillus sp. J2TS4]GIP35251.1 sugar ABC transporter substrate-binding protein [Paenibacillus sp. J2TS4]
MENFKVSKKLLSSVSIAALAVTVAACGGGGSDNKGAAPTSSPPASQAPKTEGDDKTEKPQLRQLMPFDRFDPNKEPVAAYLKEATGYDVKYEQLPAENADEKLNLLMANQESYDFMKIAKNQFARLAASGALEPLDELIEKYGTNMQKVIYEETWNSVIIDGKKYGIPEGTAGTQVGTELVVRQDWLDELGLEMPTNTDELYDVLKTIKEKKNIIPLTGGKDPMVGDIASTFGITTDWVEQDGKLVHAVELPGMKEYLAFMNKLYQEGLMDPEWGINTSAKAIEKFSSGKAAMYRLAWWDAGNINNALAKNFPDAKISIVPFLKNKDGQVTVVGTAGVSYVIAIPKWSKHKEDAIKYIDMKLEEDIFKGLAIGEEGVHHEVKDGKYYPIHPKFADEWSNASAFLTGSDQEKYPDYWQARVRKDENVQTYFETFQANAEDKKVIDPLSYAPPIDAISKNTQKLAKLREDSFIKFIGGVDSLDNYDKFLEQWRAQGGDEMIKAANEWYQSSK